MKSIIRSIIGFIYHSISALLTLFHAYGLNKKWRWLYTTFYTWFK